VPVLAHGLPRDRGAGRDPPDRADRRPAYAPARRDLLQAGRGQDRRPRAAAADHRGGGSEPARAVMGGLPLLLTLAFAAAPSPPARPPSPLRFEGLDRLYF